MGGGCCCTYGHANFRPHFPEKNTSSHTLENMVINYTIISNNYTIQALQWVAVTELRNSLLLWILKAHNHHRYSPLNTNLIPKKEVRMQITMWVPYQTIFTRHK
jgi:hypothetical protein